MKAFKDLVIDFIKAIPEGKVATYGQIAGLAGAPRNARQVGEILHGVKDSDDIPLATRYQCRGRNFYL